MSQETLEFKTELKQLMDIIIHSLYSHKEVFLRELVSNAADAIDKFRFEALREPALAEGDDQWEVRITPDEKAGTLTIADNGTGMDREAIVKDLGTIARSGTREFIEKLKAAKEEARPALIGQFGVGFYSAFMVADRITVTSRRAGDPAHGVRWDSDGQGTFSVEPVAKAKRGTEIVLHLKEEAKEYLSGWKLRETIKRFSDFVEHPVILVTPKMSDKGEPTGETEAETVNRRQAIWLRPRHEVLEKEYEEFYQHLSHDSEGPLATLHWSAEGTLEFKALLFLPGKRPFDLFMRERRKGLHLYVNRIFIFDDCEKLLPQYLDFVHGVVDSSDLPLNVSREMLQEDKHLPQIRKNLVKKVLGTLKEMREKENEKYLRFWKEFGVALKAGGSQDWENREALSALYLFETTRTKAGEYRTLDQIVESLPEGQEHLWYMLGESREALESSPHLEAAREKGWEVILLTDPVDEFFVQGAREHKGKNLKALDRGALPVDSAREAELKLKEKDFEPLVTYLRTTLTGLQNVRLSARLKESPLCLVADEHAPGAQMERWLRETGQPVPSREPILELNPDHATVQALKTALEKDAKDPRLESWVRALHEAAIVASGGKPKNPGEHLRRVADLIAQNGGR